MLIWKLCDFYIQSCILFDTSVTLQMSECHCIRNQMSKQLLCILRKESTFIKVQFVLGKACMWLTVLNDYSIYIPWYLYTKPLYQKPRTSECLQCHFYQCWLVQTRDKHFMMCQIHSAKDECSDVFMKCSHWVQNVETVWKCCTF